MDDDNSEKGTDGRKKRKGGFGSWSKALFTSKIKLRNNDEYIYNKKIPNRWRISITIMYVLTEQNVCSCSSPCGLDQMKCIR